MITPEQCRMARAALQIGVRDLAQAAGVASMTVSRFENGHSGGQAETLRKIQTALEQRGIEFIAEDASGAGSGIRMRTRLDPYSHFPFPIFNFDFSFGRGPIGIYRPDRDFNSWHSLTIVQLTNPKIEFPKFGFDDNDTNLDYANMSTKELKQKMNRGLEYISFWAEELSRGDTVQRITDACLQHIDGPRKPDHPSKLRWMFYQPENAYPEARRIISELLVDWSQVPAKLKHMDSDYNMQRAGGACPPPGLPYYLLDEFNRT